MLRLILFSMALIFGSVTSVHAQNSELDVTQEQIDDVKALPQTVVLRRSRSAPHNVDAAFVMEHVKAGQRIQLVFERIDLDREMSGLANNRGIEGADEWQFGYPGYNNGYPHTAQFGYGGYGHAIPGHGHAYFPHYHTIYNGMFGVAYIYSPENYWAYPTFNYDGNPYYYYPYWKFSDDKFDYAYCHWGF